MCLCVSDTLTDTFIVFYSGVIIICEEGKCLGIIKEIIVHMCYERSAVSSVLRTLWPAGVTKQKKQSQSHSLVILLVCIYILQMKVVPGYIGLRS